MSAKGQRTEGSGGARPRAEWPELGGVSMASIHGWTEATRPWWDGMEATAFQERLGALELNDLQALSGELRIVGQRIAQQLVHVLKNGDPWVQKARWAADSIALKKRIVSTRLTAFNEQARRAGEARKKARLLLVAQAENCLKSGDVAAAVASLCVLLRHANGETP